MITRRKLLVLICLFLISAVLAAAWLFQEEEYRRFDSSDGKYTAVVTYRRYTLLLPAFPGQSGDKAGFIKIEDGRGANYGKVPVPMVWMASDLEWGDGGARLKFVGEWDFSTREHQYWDVGQIEEIVKVAR